MTLPSGSVILYPPPEDGAPWLLAVFKTGGEVNAFAYAQEVDARNARTAMKSEATLSGEKQKIAPEDLNASNDE